jgi:hypothetical protein
MIHVPVRAGAGDADLGAEFAVLLRGKQQAGKFEDFGGRELLRDGHRAHAAGPDKDYGWEAGPAEDPHDVLLPGRSSLSPQTRPNPAQLSGGADHEI